MLIQINSSIFVSSEHIISMHINKIVNKSGYCMVIYLLDGIRYTLDFDTYDDAVNMLRCKNLII